MNLPPVVAPAFGAVAILASTATLTFNISFARSLQHQNSSDIGAVAIVASSLNALSLVSLVLVMRTRSQLGQLQDGWRRQITAIGGLLSLFSGAATFTTYLWMHIRRVDLPSQTLGASTTSLLIAAFVCWAISTLAHTIFLLTIVLDRRAAQRSGALNNAEEPATFASEMRENSPQMAPRTSGGKEFASDDSRTSTWSSRKRSGSDTMTSLRSSITTHVVRPISSKSRLITASHKHRPTSLDSGTGEREIVEDSFDSWDTSAVDAQSRQTVMNSTSPSTNTSPIPPRFLETIPASPTGSRSPSPGFPLDLEPLPPFAHRRRSRSASPATSLRMPPREGAASPGSLHGSESHIHPLFRSDSPTPPPSATPGTIVTAAPNAGQVIPLSERRSIQRMRSGSLPNSPSPLVHSSSMDDIRVNRTRSPFSVSPNPLSPVELSDEEESEEGRVSPPEREMTPPIPEWILGAGQRSSLTGYARRKTGGLGAVGEEGT